MRHENLSDVHVIRIERTSESTHVISDCPGSSLCSSEASAATISFHEEKTQNHVLILLWAE